MSETAKATRTRLMARLEEHFDPARGSMLRLLGTADKDGLRKSFTALLRAIKTFPAEVEVCAVNPKQAAIYWYENRQTFSISVSCSGFYTFTIAAHPSASPIRSPKKPWGSRSVPRTMPRRSLLRAAAARLLAKLPEATDEP